MRFLFFALFFVFPTICVADNASLLTSEYEECINAHSSNVEWAGCGKQEIERQEQFLQSAWESVSVIIEKHDKLYKEDMLSELAVEQKNWVVWKDSACKYYTASSMGRESAVLSYPYCKAQIIAERALTLNALIDELKLR